MRRAGVPTDVQRYVTGHVLNDILNEYVSIDPAREMQPYFTQARPLLDAIIDRGRQLGMQYEDYRRA
jgi:hypothetical protein